LLTATEAAVSDRAISVVGAFIAEDALQLHHDHLLQPLSEAVRGNHKLARVVAAAHLTGLPEHVWKTLNAALRDGGIPDAQLVDWSTIKVLPPESD
jgi:hypothetical protein